MSIQYNTITIPFCNLKAPATCENLVDGKLSHITLCGGNQLDEKVKGCPQRQVETYVKEAGTGGYDGK